jgi:hypothetical protein
MVKPDIEYETNRSRAIPTEVQVPIALQYLASNARQVEIAKTFKLDQKTILTCIHRVCESLVAKREEFIYFSDNNHELDDIKRAFYNKHSFPGMRNIHLFHMLAYLLLSSQASLV